jgi:hypothetical protein
MRSTGAVPRDWPLGAPTVQRWPRITGTRRCVRTSPLTSGLSPRERARATTFTDGCCTPPGARRRRDAACPMPGARRPVGPCARRPARPLTACPGAHAHASVRLRTCRAPLTRRILAHPAHALRRADGFQTRKSRPELHRAPDRSRVRVAAEQAHEPIPRARARCRRGARGVRQRSRPRARRVGRLCARGHRRAPRRRARAGPSPRPRRVRPWPAPRQSGGRLRSARVSPPGTMLTRTPPASSSPWSRHTRCAI